MWGYFALAAIQAAQGASSADTIQRNAELQEEVDNLNAKYAEFDANNMRKAGYSRAAQYEAHVEQSTAAQRAAFAGSDVAVGYGTAAQVQGDSQFAGMINVLQLQRQGREQAFGMETQALNMRLGGQMKAIKGEMDANAAVTEGLLEAAKTGVSGYERYNSTGTGNTRLTGSSDTPTWKQPRILTLPTLGSSVYGESRRPASFTSELGGGD